MANKDWKQAIVEVLTNANRPLHYTEIADLIIAEGLRDDFGATPAITVNNTINTSFRKEGKKSPFLWLKRGLYALRARQDQLPTGAKEDEYRDKDTGGINALGMYWNRDSVGWARTSSRVLGQQQLGSREVDMAEQRGVYILYDGRFPVYVGRAVDRGLGKRLFEHTVDRLNGRWNRFSWFGIHQVSDDGNLICSESFVISPEELIVTMEAILIEGLEPPQNRKRGDDFNAVEYLQVEDPETRKERLQRMVSQVKFS